MKKSTLPKENEKIYEIEITSKMKQGCNGTTVLFLSNNK